MAVLSPNHGAASETFIRAHIERLPLPTTAVYGGGWGRFTDGGSLWPIRRFAGRALRTIAPGAAVGFYDRALAGALRSLDAQVVLAEYGTTGVEVHRACRIAAIPMAVHFFGFDAWRESVVERHLEGYRELFRSARAIIAVSRSIRERLESWGAPAEKLHHVVCGADETRFHGARPAEAPPRFLAVGRFVEKKGPLHTLRAFGEVRAALRDATLTMVGDGPLLASARQLAADLGLANAVTFTGSLAPSEVIELLRRARAFVQHSVTAEDGDREGTPVAILEAQMAGLPVVSTRHSGIPEVVRDGETGYLVAEGDWSGMGRAMTRLALEPGHAGAIGAAARRHALASFKLDVSLARLAEILRRAALEGRA